MLAGLGSGGFEPSKAEPTDLQNQQSLTLCTIKTHYAPNFTKSQLFFANLAHIITLKPIESD